MNFLDYAVANNGFGTNVSGVVKQTEGYCIAFTCHSVNTAIRYFQLFNSAAVPSNGAVPKYSFVIPAGSATVPSIRHVGSEFFTLNGCYFSTGIAWGFSSTYGTYTAATAADHGLNLNYV